MNAGVLVGCDPLQVDREDKVMKRDYEAPVVRELGSLTQLTGQLFNKVGGQPDVFTAETGGSVVGSLVVP